jgi:hypothetical protein
MHDGGSLLNKRSIPIAVLSCVLAVAGIAGYCLPPPVAEAIPARLLMENPGGRIVFTHKAHASPDGTSGGAACADCHHDLRVAPSSGPDGAQPSVLPCTACHGAADDPGFLLSHQERYLDEGGEASCLSCHHTRIAGLSEKWNHQEHREYSSDDCESCHHPVNYEARPGRFMEIKPQKCSNCHTDKPNPLTSTTVKDASHKRCESCHEDLFADKPRGCATCHTLPSLADESANGATGGNQTACGVCHTPIIGGMDAFHDGCMGCHDENGKGPGRKAPCAQCHRP